MYNDCKVDERLGRWMDELDGVGRQIEIRWVSWMEGSQADGDKMDG